MLHGGTTRSESDRQNCWPFLLYRSTIKRRRGVESLRSGVLSRDTIGVFNRDTIGVDNMMWCNDFPHSYGPWPHSIEQINKDMGSLDERDRYKILAGNAVRLFNL
jgi:hypothetical protein